MSNLKTCNGGQPGSEERDGGIRVCFFFLRCFICVLHFDRNLSMPVSHSKRAGSLILMRRNNLITLLVSPFLFPFWLLSHFHHVCWLFGTLVHLKWTEPDRVVVSDHNSPFQLLETEWSHLWKKGVKKILTLTTGLDCEHHYTFGALRGCCLLVLL